VVIGLVVNTVDCGVVVSCVVVVACAVVTTVVNDVVIEVVVISTSMLNVSSIYTHYKCDVTAGSDYIIVHVTVKIVAVTKWRPNHVSCDG